jgi:hypothetical protein
MAAEKAGQRIAVYVAFLSRRSLVFRYFRKYPSRIDQIRRTAIALTATYIKSSMRIIESLSWLWIGIGIVGAAAVIIGVWGEEVADRKNLPTVRKERLKKQYWKILLTGLSMDLIGLIGSALTSHSFELKVEQLKAQRQWRTIPQYKMNHFIELTKTTRKVPIKIVLGMTDYETENFRTDLQNMLTQSGFTNQEVIRRPEISINGPMVGGDNLDEFPLWAFVLFHRNNGAKNEIQVLFDIQKTNQIKGVFFYTDTNGVLGTIIDSLNQSGVPVILKDSGGLVSPDEIGIFIPEKLH